MIVAELTGAAQHHARWEPPDDETAAAIAESRARKRPHGMV